MSNSEQHLPSTAQGPAPRPFFTRFSQQVARYAGKPVTFFGAMVVIVIWGATGPLFGFDDTWQLIINTSTTIITFLMVFLIQNSQNRDTAALQIKLDELIARTEGPRNALLDLEDLDEEMLDRLRADYARLADLARAEVDEGAEMLSPERSIGEICDPDQNGAGVWAKHVAKNTPRNAAKPAKPPRSSRRAAPSLAAVAKAGEKSG